MQAFFEAQETTEVNVGQIKYLENEKDLHVYIAFNGQKKPAMEQWIASLPSDEHLTIRIAPAMTAEREREKAQPAYMLQIICRNIEKNAKEIILNFLGEKKRSYESIEKMCIAIINLFTENLSSPGKTAPLANFPVESDSAEAEQACCDRTFSLGPE